MFGYQCWWGKPLHSLHPNSHPQPQSFSLPAPIPQWPQGEGFATGNIALGEIEVCEVTDFEFIWGCKLTPDSKSGISFYKPCRVPSGYFILGYYCQSNRKPVRGCVLVAREAVPHRKEDSCTNNPDHAPALINPLSYSLVWCIDERSKDNFNGGVYIWCPQPPDGYKALGYLVTNKLQRPNVEEVRCVRADLTDNGETYHQILKIASTNLQSPLEVWSTRPRDRGIHEKGVAVGTFFCSSDCSSEEINVACLRNLSSNLHAMPNLNQVHALIKHYGPTVFFHPSEIYMPSSVSWFFQNGALLYRKNVSHGENIDSEGSNLPAGGTNDGEYWIDLPSDARRETVKQGNLASAKLYVHVKPALGGTFTDIVMWVFCPFNGPGILKFEFMNVSLGKIGQHVGDWEHFTLRISNFTGELWSIYLSQHSGGQWVEATDLEFIEENKAIIYSSKYGHACFHHPGTYLQGSSKIGIGIRNDAAQSNHYVESNNQYVIVAAEYLGDGVVTEPTWLQFMREWGPTIIYNSRIELDKIINRLPPRFRDSLRNVFAKFPNELSGEEGPTGPKEKNNWFGDERWKRTKCVEAFGFNHCRRGKIFQLSDRIPTSSLRSYVEVELLVHD
ncbi:Vacuolar sorting-associated protein 62 [Heracleum sosnowskyi]|uniref:Vacuolar sorting-associated protein 62 n=1 Tax=Heracleum sosnowskyi TaxID=360622 RepID=A0AAD8N6T6_9APIA|nr:Vacuolar sorting-associated protein 62 [Heracleum sosnowskyi]